MVEEKSNDISLNVRTADPGSSLHIKYLEHHKKEGENAVKEKPDHVGIERASYYEYALVLTEVFDEEDVPLMKKLRINSPHICDTLKSVVKCYPAYRMGFSSPMEIESPFGLLYHHFNQLSERQMVADGVKQEHFNLLVSYLRNDASFEAIELIEKGLTTFHFLWAVFKPGDYVRYVFSSDQDCILWLEDTAYRTEDDGDYFELRCYCSASDGGRYGKKLKKLKIYDRLEFSGGTPVPIEKLPVIPLDRCPDLFDLKSSLRSRGEKYRSFKNGGMLQHKGLFTSFDETTPWDIKLVPYTLSGRVIVDMKMFFEDHDSQREQVLPWNCAEENIDEEDTMFLYEPFLYGYSLGISKWGQLLVKDLEPVQWDVNMFNDLVLAQPQKELLKSLAQRHYFGQERPPKDMSQEDENTSSPSALLDSRDITKSKGKGLVVALHGPPGTGKPMTAVALAEKTKRPIVILPAGGLGRHLHSFPSDLRRAVEYATKWKAILLIDEADVFLEKRETGPRSNLERNGLVAVFLNQLEYCQGIVFLTSNRAESFDPAIKSRLHLMLHYPRPNRKARQGVWQSHLNNVPAGDIELDIPKASASLSKFAMNNREISNAIRSASTLAKDQSSKLSQAHLDLMLRVWRDSNPTWPTDEDLMSIIIDSRFIVVVIVLCIGILVAFGISSRGYQVLKNKDVMIFYR